MNQTSYPLSWPSNWKRRNHRATSSFGSRSIDQATRAVLNQLRITGVPDYRVIISTNLMLRNDGYPKSGQPQPADPAVAVYFQLMGKARVLACDKWNRVEDNIWAIAKDLEALRGRERWGVGTIEQAFAGYAALPAPGQSEGATWYNVLGVAESCVFEHARDRYRDEALLCHPDSGGSHESMVRLNAAWDMARKHFGK